ncbi:CHASE2 domain-containing protein [Chroococcidiopsis sp.]|uniref:CHASE2 domain-containing protein n=1 Tax=Chroococcidiopsis sp. TaxID=3088168 RepID=UPI003F3681F1
MSKLVVLSLGNGDLHHGFSTVTAKLREEGDAHHKQFCGSLPAAPEIIELYRNWRLVYLALCQRLELNSRIEIEAGGITNVSEIEFRDLCQQLPGKINSWLNFEPFRHIERQLRTQLDPAEEIRVIIETNDRLLQQLPWHLWQFCEDYPKAEIALSGLEYKRKKRVSTKISKAKVRILAIFGNSKGIDLEPDRLILKQLSELAEIEFLVEPPLEDLHDCLRQNWDILFFAGHSSSQAQGSIQLNQTDSLTLDRLKYALRKAIGNGLKLAIFNSCDGLGLARSLAELDIPQVIVMREPIADAVAHEFLKYFLSAFAGGQTLYTAVREARERLEKLESKYPCATWLPTIYQNQAEPLTAWRDWCAPQEVSSVVESDRAIGAIAHKLGRVLLTSVAIAGLVVGARQLGILQTWELQAFDLGLRLRSREAPDPRLLIVKVTEADVHKQKLNEKRSLSDAALARLLEKLRPHQPQVIGLDIYRDFPVNPNQAKLANYLQDDRFIAICEVERAKEDYPGISSPPEIPKNRLGFSDLPVDSDRVIRRQLLFMDINPKSACVTNESFSFRVARLYLGTKGIQPQRNSQQNWQLGSVILPQLEPSTGGYHQLDALGYQILLNYRATDPVAQQVTLSEILSGSLDAELPLLVKDRIVLIGTTAESFKDYHPTPSYSTTSESRELPGVAIHAHMVSQILSAVLDDRPLLWWLPSWGENLWIWGWALVGSVLGWRWRSPLQLGLVTATALGILSGLCFVLLLKGGWLPLIPAAIAGAIATVVTYKVTQPERKS